VGNYYPNKAAVDFGHPQSPLSWSPMSSGS